MSTSRILSYRLRARYGAVAAIAAVATNAYLTNRPVIRLDTSHDQSTSLHALPFTRDLPRRHYVSLHHPSGHKRGATGLIPDAEKHEVDTSQPGFRDNDTSAWSSFSENFDAIRTSMSSIEWTDIGNKITDILVPWWARQLPELLSKLQLELSFAPGSLADEIWKEAADVEINPEIMWDAQVRISRELPVEELNFRKQRKKHVTAALAKYLGLKEDQIHPDDVPTIAICGSGGGLRALVAGTSSYLSAQEAGLWDCSTYTAGVSGSCWLQTLYFSSLAGQNHRKLIQHLKNRINVHIAFPPAALKAVTTAPTNKYLLSGFVEKLKGDPAASFGLVDVYGMLLAARLLVPKGELQVCDRDLKLSNQREHVDGGAHPMPIYTAVRHEIPIEEEEKKLVEEGKSSTDDVKERAQKEAWFQWFEFTPYEFFCEELEAGIPIWALGRTFRDGHNAVLETGLALPEFRIPLLMGVWGSAFCATLSHYYKEIRPALIGLAGFDGLDSLIEERNEDLVKLHPIDPATVPNYVVGLKDKLPDTCPASLFHTDHIQLMDAGMSNNLPIYPLLRPGRDVDVIIAFDASADVKRENWLSVVDGYAKQRGIKGWPIGSGWPKPSSNAAQNAAALEEAQATSPQEAAMKLSEAREDARQEGSPTRSADDPDNLSRPEDTDLGYCTVWVGSLEERASGEEPPPSKRLKPSNEDDCFNLLQKDAGMTLIYFPLLPNPKVPGVAPDETEFLSTWNFIYTADDIDSVVDLARTNFLEGAQQTKDTIRAVYERKKTLRLEREQHSRIKSFKHRLREDGDHFA
ncbi:putative phospholipase a2 [Phaeomoniella chlamydospora]|uniref:Lysophospholipase n=1 Tax=Phaeomoniella chlamydospora TaxID=158046 RepID=A0A0G2GXV0_PHACM|nr:putative phospholipase a2 [Phaeomoniella chlamydospora]